MLARRFSSLLACSEPFWPCSLGHGVFPCFWGDGVSWSAALDNQGLASVYRNIVFFGDGVF